jgi:hypothetical protein
MLVKKDSVETETIFVRKDLFRKFQFFIYVK